MLDRHNTFPRP